MFKKFISLLFYAIFCFSAICEAQIGGKGVFRFLNLPNSAKVAALGNGFPVANDAEFNQTFANPSLINASHQNATSLNYSNYISDINFGSAQYGLKFKEKETISLGLMFINYGNFEEYTEIGNPTGGNFTAGDYLLNVGYAKNWKEKIYYGANAKIIYGSYDIYNSFAIATDLAVTYKDSSSNIATGILLKNIGYQLSAFDQSRENLPFQMAFSFSQKLRYAPFKYHITYNNLQQFNLSNSNPNANEDIDLVGGETKNNKNSFVNKFSQHFIFGAEILLSQSFNLQAGYNLQQSRELSISGLGGLSGFSFGFSLHLEKLSLSYAHSTLNLAGSNNYFSLGLNPSFLRFK
ncbi:type IX secretion system protein PorQ [Pedobacter alpinus]|uniref:Type IX secretion system protein PorQ n=1 Tax=Pedobacter alpinus TaxID=1590643 RepID=A0ABW5TVE3_9SPHI